ncbi:MAG: DUF1405 domain-containing protein [Anaerolineae bacterium]|nr:DUF1405 domain-containing protein [Anaerolineae bacterium]
MLASLAELYNRVRLWVLTPSIVALIVAIDLFSFVVGCIFWYGRQLPATPWWAWVFVPDCPLFALLGGIAIVGLLTGHRSSLFESIVAMGSLKYAIWTIVAWVLYYAEARTMPLVGVVMIVSHIGLAVQGLFILSFVRLDAVVALLSGAWFLLSDYMDYGLGFHPGVPSAASLPWMQWHTIAVTIGLTLAFLWMARVPINLWAGAWPVLALKKEARLSTQREPA